MQQAFAGLMVLWFAAAQAGASLLFKLAGEATGSRAWWLFAAGNAVGFGCTLSLLWALKGQNPNVIYAACYGGGFVLLQILSWWLFHVSLSPWQWAGVVLIAVGIILLQVKI
jgi:multidrug transporter EmrE-like cation transporter